jgi:hypothetical protein
MKAHDRVPGFDPFLRDVRGAEVLRAPGDLSRAVARLVGREVLVAGDGGRVEVARLVGPLTLRFEVPCPFAEGEAVALTDHRGLRYTGVRTTISSVFMAEGAPTARLRVPSIAVFYPGRRDVRLEGDLGARIELDHDGVRTPARALDISMGGIGVQIDVADGFVTGQVFTVCLDFGDGELQLPARVRSAVVDGDAIRLGVEFAAHAAVDALSRRLHGPLAAVA